MNNSLNEAWQQLFGTATAGAAADRRRFQLLRRRGEPLLLLPAETALLPDSLALYPAQSWRARWLRKLAGWAVQFHLPGVTEALALPLDPSHSLVKFLAAGMPGPAPCFAMLLGNPKTAGRRFILLVFDESNQPVKVVKAGVGAAARELVARETDFLTATVGKLSGVPRVLGNLATAEVQAVALEYVAGVAPDARQHGAAIQVLQPWLDQTRTVPLPDLPVWQRLQAAAGNDPIFLEVARALAAVRLHPAVFHGDFAPWNIRAQSSSGVWVVLDWERGESAGPPAWDWFHFVIQPLLLVKKLPVERLGPALEAALASPEFAAYAAAAEITGCARALLLAYLLYCRDVLKPAEGMTPTVALLEWLRRRWQPL